MRLVRKQELDRDFYSDKFTSEMIKFELEQKLKLKKEELVLSSDIAEPINIENILYPESEI